MSARGELPTWVDVGLIPLLNLAAPVVGCVFMVHVARTLRPPARHPDAIFKH